MKKLPCLLFSVLMALCFQSCGKRGVDLKFMYKPGQTVQYRLVSEVKTRTTTNSVTNHHAINIEMLVRYTVERITDKGDAVLQFNYDMIRYLNTSEPEKAEEIMNQLRNARITVTMSPWGDITDVKGYESLPRLGIEDFNLLTMLLKALPVFPRSPIEIGRQWEREQEYPIENGLVKGNMLVFKRFSLKDTTATDSGRLARINSEISMKFDVPQSDVFTLSAEGNERLGLDGTGSVHFDRTTGEVLKANAAIFGKLVVSVRHPVTHDIFRTRVELAQSINMSRL